MFKKFFQALRTGDLLNSALKDANEMLVVAEDMFQSVTDLLLYRKPIEFDVYRQDQEINRMEMEVRKKVMEHLSVHPKQDIVACLTLTTMIVSVERLGDYSKNIYELAQLYPGGFDQASSTESLAKLTAEVMAEFELTIKSIRQEHQPSAMAVLVKHREISTACDDIIKQYVEHGAEDASLAVMSVLYSRYLKRTSAHLMNIASITLNPFDRIGFYPVKGKKAEELESIFGYASDQENDE